MQQIDGRVVIDTSSYLQFNAGQKIDVSPLVDSEDVVQMNGQENYDNYGGTYYRTGDIYSQPQLDWNEVQSAITSKGKGAPKAKQELSDEELLLCSHIMRGFSLKMKNWLKLEVNNVHDIEWNEEAFENLVLPGDYKKLLLAFSESQRSSSNIFDDVIKGKGKGMVMLLNGPPGVGKTLTAESVAEKMRVPLYSISAGELGLTPMGVEIKLRRVFDLTKNWNAVVLLDEADIFLEKRRMDDLVRNELVSIFLQNLEYFEGTLFLTTNRVETFDPAFESRIHISIAYPELSHFSRRQVWHNFLQRIPEEKRDVSEADLDFFAGVTLNGRQIKNAVKAAGLLAFQDGKALTSAHVKTVLGIMKAIKPGQ